VNNSLPNDNIGLPKNVVHGPIGTSAWFFPFLTDYFTVLNSTANFNEVEEFGKFGARQNLP